jgi:hypothetical protein
LADVLPLKLLSPELLAVSVGDPLAVKANDQLPAPALSGPLQLWPVLAVTVTVPVGTPVPVTLKFTVIARPTSEGLGPLEVITRVLVALFTVIVTESVV